MIEKNDFFQVVKKNPGFCKAALKGFLGATITTIFFAKILSLLIPTRDSSKVELSFAKTTKLTAEEVKNRQLFMISSRSGNFKDAEINLFNYPNLFFSIFPGYDTLINDHKLWDRYFKYKFNQSIYSPELQPEPTKEIVTSWTGCFDIHQRHGSDIVVVGNSEVQSNIIPKVLYDNLDGASRKLKILHCSKGGIGQEGVMMTAEMLNRASNKSKLVIWGYSLWNGYLNDPLKKKLLKDQIEAVDHYKKFPPLKDSGIYSREENLFLSEPDSDTERNTVSGWWNYKLSQIFPSKTWSDLFPSELYMITPAKIVYEFKRDINIENVKIGPGAEGEGFTFPSIFKKRPMEIEILSRKAKPFYSHFEGISEKDCLSMEKVSQNIDIAIQNLLKISEKVLIYVPPATPLYVKHPPECFVKTLKSILKSKMNKRVIVVTDSWEAYNLNYSHFAWETSDPFTSKIDVNHTRWDGAVLVTKKLASEVVKNRGIE